MWTLPLRGGDIKRISKRMELLEARAMGISRQLWPGELPEGWLRAVSGNAVFLPLTLLRQAERSVNALGDYRRRMIFCFKRDRWCASLG
jgi:hypothetical protein